jgi:hypothetical protein
VTISTKEKITLNSIVVVTKDQVSADLSGEAAILNLKSGVYFGLNAVGASIWKLIEEPRNVKEIRDTLVKEYDVDPDQCEKDILALLEELSSKDLIEVANEKGP